MVKKNTARKIYGNLAKYCWQKDQVDVKDLLVEAIEKEASPLVYPKKQTPKGLGESEFLFLYGKNSKNPLESVGF